MNMIKFLFWLSGVYAAYYLAVILLDTIHVRGRPASASSGELTFMEDIEPFRIESEPVIDPVAMISSGGVSLQRLFMLAKEEAIEYTKAVSF